jgi:26S proteasome regulatory subunit (ATPase 3-interacting protein)
MLAVHGLKKTGVQRSLDALAASGKLTVKVSKWGRRRGDLARAATLALDPPPPLSLPQEFGKSRIYWAPQPVGEAAPSPADAAALAARKAQLADAVAAATARVAKLKAELAAVTSGPTPAEVSERLSAANNALPALKKKLADLAGDGGKPAVSAADMAAAHKAASDAVAAWAKRRAVFKECWDAITENMDRNPKSLYDDVGVETDDAAGVCLADVRAVVAAGSVGGGSKMRRT